jgi:hypothetical protein
MATMEEWVRLSSIKLKYSAIPHVFGGYFEHFPVPTHGLDAPPGRRFKFYPVESETDCSAFLNVAKRLTDEALRRDCAQCGVICLKFFSRRMPATTM